MRFCTVFAWFLPVLAFGLLFALLSYDDWAVVNPTLVGARTASSEPALAHGPRLPTARIIRIRWVTRIIRVGGP